MKTLDQIRAEYAWKAVGNVEPGLRDKYRNLAKSLPALIMSNGLMQTLAFLQSKEEGKGKGKGEHGRMLYDILRWLSGEKAAVLPPGTIDFRAAMTQLAGMLAVEYQRATEETLAILRWIRQLVDSLATGGGR